jgi:hypothetical protein
MTIPDFRFASQNDGRGFLVQSTIDNRRPTITGNP